MPNPVSVRPTPWAEVILVCRKCSRKLDGGFGDDGEDTLRTALNDELRRTGRRRRVRVLETKCLGICPKKSVVALNATRPGRVLVVPRGTGVAEALRILEGPDTLVP